MSWISWDALEKMPELTKEEAGRALDAACSQVIRNLDQFTDHFQKAYSENGFYSPTENVDWTPGFWTGEIWLAYEHTGNEALKKAGELQMASFLKRINENRMWKHMIWALCIPLPAWQATSLREAEWDGKPL